MLKKALVLSIALVALLTMSAFTTQNQVPSYTTQIDNSLDCPLQIVKVEQIWYNIEHGEPYTVTVKNDSDYYIHSASFDAEWLRVGGYGKIGPFSNIIGERFDSWTDDPIAPGETRTFFMSSGSGFSNLMYLHTWAVGYSEDGGFVETTVWRD